MKKRSDKVSIIIACYNIEKYIKKCLDSIASQTYQNIEVLMVDDGSKDNTSVILKTYEKEDSRFKYLKKENGGLSDARNYGLKRASGDYICFIDGDDYIEQDYVELLLDSIKVNKSDISVCFFNRVYDKKIKLNKVGIENYNIIKHPAAWNKMYKKSVFDEIEFKKGVWYEDLNFFGKIMLSNPKLSIVDKPLYNYIQNSSSIMHTYDKRIYQMYDVLEDIEEYSIKNNTNEINYDFLEYINIYHVLIGTVYRTSFSEDFSKKDICNICNYVEKKYKNWYKNIYIKKMSFVFKSYLFFLHHRCYSFVWLVLKVFNKYLNL